jgi:hypothetical protein
MHAARAPLGLCLIVLLLGLLAMSLILDLEPYEGTLGVCVRVIWERLARFTPYACRFCPVG